MKNLIPFISLSETRNRFAKMNNNRKILKIKMAFVMLTQTFSVIQYIKVYLNL